MSDFLAMFRPDFLLHNALWGSVAVGVFCPLIGVYFYLRRMVLLGVALPQISSAGIAFVFFLQGLGFTFALHQGEQNDRLFALVGSTVFTLLAIYILAYLEKKGEGTTESRLGAVYALAFALSILFVTQNAAGRTEFLSMLNGEIVSVNSNDLKLLLVSYGTLSCLLLLLNSQFLLISFDRDTAQVLGKKVLLWDSLLYTFLGLSISMGVLIVGPMLTFSFLIIPPLAARRFSHHMRTFFILSALIGGLSGLLGFYLSYRQDWPLAPCDIAVASAVLFVSFVIKKIQMFVEHRASAIGSQRS